MGAVAGARGDGPSPGVQRGDGLGFDRGVASCEAGLDAAATAPSALAARGGVSEAPCGGAPAVASWPGPPHCVAGSGVGDTSPETGPAGAAGIGSPETISPGTSVSISIDTPATFSSQPISTRGITDGVPCEAAAESPTTMEGSEMPMDGIGTLIAGSATVVGARGSWGRDIGIEIPVEIPRFVCVTGPSFPGLEIRIDTFVLIC